MYSCTLIDLISDSSVDLNDYGGLFQEYGLSGEILKNFSTLEN